MQTIKITLFILCLMLCTVHTLGAETTVTVKKNDCISVIAHKHYGVYTSKISSLIAEANKLSNMDLIYPGQKITVWTDEVKPGESESKLAAIGPPAPQSGSAGGNQVHVVQSGDTLWDISQLYGVSIKNLMTWNNIRSARKLKPGMVLRLQP